MNEKILRIENVENVRVEKAYSNCDGYAITTDKQTINLLIENGQNCCESWGYLLSENKFVQFIGAEILEITITDKALSTIQFAEYLGPEDMDSGGMMFVNISTSAGLLQFVAYNAHNGYYGHSAYVISDQLNVERGL